MEEKLFEEPKTRWNSVFNQEISKSLSKEEKTRRLLEKYESAQVSRLDIETLSKIGVFKIQDNNTISLVVSCDNIEQAEDEIRMMASNIEVAADSSIKMTAKNKYAGNYFFLNIYSI